MLCLSKNDDSRSKQLDKCATPAGSQLFLTADNLSRKSWRLDCMGSFKWKRKPTTDQNCCECSQTPVSSIRQSNSDQELLGLLEKVQGTRLEEQRCGLSLEQSRVELSPHISCQDAVIRNLSQLLQQPGPYPMIVLPPGEETKYWIENGCSYEMTSKPQALLSHLKRSMSEPVNANCGSSYNDQSHLIYRTHFFGKEHFNFYANDDVVGPLLLSVKAELVDDQEYIRIILRKKSGTCHGLIACSSFKEMPSPSKLAKILCGEITARKFLSVLHDKANELLLNYDEHVASSALKFGVLYQQFGQVREEELFGNKTHSCAMDDFLNLLGERVQLKNFQGFRGGLDTQHDHTGPTSVYTKYEGKEIMFHVSTLLPHSETDHQQLQRKRHIGNDIVAIIFQECNTPFSPGMIASNFLHAYLVVQPVFLPNGEVSYKISTVARADVPYFGPSVPLSGELKSNDNLKQFLLSKLINAEHACYKASKFARLEERTRTVLFESLYDELRKKTEESMSTRSNDGNNVMISFHRVFKISSKKREKMCKKSSRNDALDGVNESKYESKDSSCLSSSSCSSADDSSTSTSIMTADVNNIVVQKSSASSCSSSSADDLGYSTFSSICPEFRQSEVDIMKSEIRQLKMEKLELLKQAVANQKEIRQLRERESQLLCELKSTQRELFQMKAIVLDMSQEAAV